MAWVANGRAVVTGAGSGLGRALCVELARRGARVVASDRDLEAARETVAALERGGAEAYAVRCDVSQAAEVEGLAGEAERLLGGVDLIVNNAGVALSGRIGEVSLEDWRWMLSVNLWGVIHGCHAFVPRLRRQGRGHVLNVASAAGLIPGPPLSPYSTAKAAVVGLSETLFAEAASDGVGVTVLCPTFFETNIMRSGRGAEESFQAVAGERMRRSKVQAEDVARAALDGVMRGALYVLPHADGRWAWRLKRLMPARFHAMLPRLAASQARKLGFEMKF
jgi:NAD(P)-dependent dehydrogenase (short-subunit alcohol dehydrogenase family)